MKPPSFTLNYKLLNLVPYLYDPLQIRHMSTLEALHFDNLALKRLPIDPEEKNYVRRVSGACFSKVKPTPVENPRLVGVSPKAMSLLGLENKELERKELVEYFSGNKLLPGSEPAAHCYCGHQFGAFAGQLGDGAAMYLGEVVNANDERWEIQLKGAGLTPYSRTADGRKVLRSSLREFLCSEAMHFLGIPTSRAGTCITSDSTVMRDQFYDGHPREEQCTIVLRIAPTFIRFGSFEIFTTMNPITRNVGPSVGRRDILHSLLNYVIETFYPEVQKSSLNDVEKYAAFFKEIVVKTSNLVALWQTVGFCHGVLNTDNMSIIGLTLDYGPFGFLDVYDPNHVCNASDTGHRYSFKKQPEICLWNLKKLAESIKDALPLDMSYALLDLYEKEYQKRYMEKMHAKLGIIASENPADKELCEELLNTMENTGADFTNTFLCFLLLDTSDPEKIETSIPVMKEKLLEICYSRDELLKHYSAFLPSNYSIKHLYNAVFKQGVLAESSGNIDLDKVQEYIPFIHHLQTAGRLEEMTDESKSLGDRELWKTWCKKYVNRIKKDMECFSGNADAYHQERMKIMRSNNPRFILRNHIAEEAIRLAEKDDYSLVQKLIELIDDPYNLSFADLKSGNEKGSYAARCDIVEDKSPDWAFSIKVS